MSVLSVVSPGPACSCSAARPSSGQVVFTTVGSDWVLAPVRILSSGGKVAATIIIKVLYKKFIISNLFNLTNNSLSNVKIYSG